MTLIEIAKKEFKVAFTTPLIYVVSAGFMCLSGFFFFSLLQSYNEIIPKAILMPSINPNLNQWVVTPYFQTLEIILIFLIPILTMRAISEEKQNGTYELLITSPLKVSDIVLGKFLGTIFVILSILLLSFIFPLVLIVFADPEVLPTLIGFLGVLIFSISFASIGLAVSASTKSQTIAGVISLVLILLIYVIDAPAQYFPSNIQSILEYLSPSNRMNLIAKGVIDISDIIYFFSLMLVGIFAANRILEAGRWR